MYAIKPSNQAAANCKQGRLFFSRCYPSSPCCLATVENAHKLKNAGLNTNSSSTVRCCSLRFRPGQCFAQVKYNPPASPL